MEVKQIENEQTSNEEGEKTQGESNSTQEGEGEGKKTLSNLDRADLNVEAMKRENDRKDELITRAGNLAARKMVGGEAEAGSPSNKPKEETNSEYAERIQSGGEYGK